MTETGRFFDAVSYTEADQAEVQRRFRADGVLGEVAGLLAVGVPGGLFVSVAAGEAMVQGFWYKNTVSKNLAIAANVSGSTRIDRVVLRLLRTSNSLTSVVVQGTPGGGLPAITQVVGGDWDYPLATVTVPTATTTVVTAAMLADVRTYSYTLNSSDPVNGEMLTTAKGAYKSLVIDPATKILQWAEYAEPRKNHLDNPTHRFNQRGTTTITGAGTAVLVDRWRQNSNTSKYNQSWAAPTIPTDQIGSNIPFSIGIVSTGGGAVAAADFAGFTQFVEGYTWSKLFNQPLVLSWWDYSNVVATYAIGLRSIGGDRTFTHPYTVPVTNTWVYNWVAIPPMSGGTWSFVNAIAAYVDWWTAAGATSASSLADTWQNGVFVGHTSMTNNLTVNGNVHYIAAPKLEIGTVPSRFVIPDFIEDQQRCLRQLWRLTLTNAGGRFGSTFGRVVGPTDMQFYLIPPVRMRTDPPGVSVNDITHMRADSISGRTMTSLAINATTTSPDVFGLSAGGVSGSPVSGAIYELFGNTAGDWIQFGSEL